MIVYDSFMAFPLLHPTTMKDIQCLFWYNCIKPDNLFRRSQKRNELSSTKLRNSYELNFDYINSV